MVVLWKALSRTSHRAAECRGLSPLRLRPNGTPFLSLLESDYQED